LSAFAATEDLYRDLGGFFATLTMSDVGQLIHRVGGPLLFVYHRPEGRILWVPAEVPGTWPAFTVRCGEEAAGSTPLLIFEQDGDLADRFWRGEVDLAQALARQQLRATGPLSRAMKLLPHLDPVYPRYAEYRRQTDTR
jgi:hypothetical protein